MTVPQPLTPDEALRRLETCRELIRLARNEAQIAHGALTAARRVRALELVDKLADAQQHAERLGFIVTGDIRADAAHLHICEVDR